jgi:hypothetical protein
MDKFILKSKTVIGAIVMLLPVLAQLFGFAFSAEDGALITNGWDQVIQAIGAVLVIFGRFTAKSGLSLNPFK